MVYSSICKCRFNLILSKVKFNQLYIQVTYVLYFFNDLTVSHLITDRHASVKKYMREEQTDIQHWFDVWHCAKGNKKLSVYFKYAREKDG